MNARPTLREILEGYRRFNAWEVEEEKRELPIYASKRIPVDLGLGFLPYEMQAVERAILVEYRGVKFPVCTAEDLIVHKAISEREKDWSDIEGILVRQGAKLDQAYIIHWLEQFALALGQPDLVQRYNDLQEKVKKGSEDEQQEW